MALSIKDCYKNSDLELIPEMYGTSYHGTVIEGIKSDFSENCLVHIETVMKYNENKFPKKLLIKDACPFYSKIGGMYSKGIMDNRLMYVNILLI